MPTPYRRCPWSLPFCQHERRQRLQRSSGAAHGPQTRHKAAACIVGARRHPTGARRRPALAPRALTARAAFSRCLGRAEVPRRGARTAGALWGVRSTLGSSALHFSFKHRAAPPLLAHAGAAGSRCGGGTPRRDPAAPAASLARPNRARGYLAVSWIAGHASWRAARPLH